MLRMKNVTMRKWLWLSLAVVALDQISKAMASSELIAYGPPVAVASSELTQDEERYHA